MSSDSIELGNGIPGCIWSSVEFLSVIVLDVSLFKRVAESVEVVGFSSIDGAAANFQVSVIKLLSKYQTDYK